MVCSRGESLTHRKHQMKLFNAIAAAAVIGTSFIAANAVEARNGWLFAGRTTRDGTCFYVKPISKNGRYVTFLEKSSSSASTFEKVADCSAWRYRWSDENKWIDTMP